MRVAVLIPCYNEAAAVQHVVQGFTQALPSARIYVFDNNSTDETALEAKAAGAEVRFVGERGKGNVVRRMFADVEADVYVLVDGDGTYDPSSAAPMIAQLLEQGLDVMVGRRIAREEQAYRTGHVTGNRLLTGFAAWLFGRASGDMLSGYRVFSRRYVKSFPAFSSGFEIETELTVHALQLRMPIGEIDTNYFARIAGTESKLNTFRDGSRILLTIIRLLKSERPFLFFGVGFMACALVAIGLAIPVFQTYVQTGLVPRLPTALLCAAIALFGTILLACGIILESVTIGRHELRRALYLAHLGPLQTGESSDHP
jgi:glycosyltransferase involved in cell wall biosynthesis